MLLWLILFLIVVGLSLYLSLRSMSDFLDFPSGSLFLIQNPRAFSLDALKIGEIASFEQLFKGDQKALVVYGSRELKEFSGANLLELEDYLKVDEGQVLAWELNHKFELPAFSLRDDEQLFIQTVCQRIDHKFKATRRAVVVSPDPQRRIELGKRINHRLNKKLTSGEIFKHYKKRGYYPLAQGARFPYPRASSVSKISSDSISKLLIDR